jgi:hypothetical protein
VVSRDEQVYELSKKYPWYKYELFKKHLSPQRRDAEVKKLIKDLRV